jgi:serine/threonine protein kinase
MFEENSEFMPKILSLIYLNFCFSVNLYELIKKNNYQGFSINLIRKFAYSLVHCLRLLYRENIIHCDLKPVSHSFLNSIFINSINYYAIQ